MGSSADFFPYKHCKHTQSNVDPRACGVRVGPGAREKHGKGPRMGEWNGQPSQNRSRAFVSMRMSGWTVAEKVRGLGDGLGSPDFIGNIPAGREGRPAGQGLLPGCWC